MGTQKLSNNSNVSSGINLEENDGEIMTLLLSDDKIGVEDRLVSPWLVMFFAVIIISGKCL